MEKYYTWNGEKIIEYKKDCIYYLNNNIFCQYNKEFYTCKDCKYCDIPVKFNFYERYENLLKGKSVNFDFDELQEIIKNINNNGINTLMIQQSLDKDYYYVKIDNNKIR